MQKFIRIALPWICIAVMVWCLFFDGINYLDWTWLVGVAGIGVVCYIGLYVKLHKLQKQLQKQKEEHLCLLKKQAEEAEEAVAPELEKVKGNSLKKEMIKRRLVREYIERNSDDCSEENIAIENIKGWLSSLIWSLGIIIAMPMLLMIILFVGLGLVGTCLSDGTGVPTHIDYHNADDLQKVTGVEFPEIVPVDSFCSDGGLAGYETQIKFVPAKPLDKDFFYRLDQACKTDSCCWRKDSTGYFYDIYPEAIPFDRTKGMHRRMVDVDGKKVPDWDGSYISVFVPIKGDTIILNDGWTR